MAFNLSYDPNEDPEVQGEIQQQEQEALEVGERLEQEQAQLLAGKYQNAAELEAAYLELQQAFSSRGQQEKPAENEERTEDTPDEQVTELVDALRAEFEQYGQLTQETADELGEELTAQVEAALQGGDDSEDDEDEAEGVPLTAEQTAQVQQLVGGAETYQAMTEWSSENISEAEQAAFNRVINSGDLNAIYWAVKGLHAQYKETVGYEGRLLRGKPPSNRGDVFRSMAELVRAQRDPRYDTDHAYRRDVELKLERSGDLV